MATSVENDPVAPVPNENPNNSNSASTVSTVRSGKRKRPTEPRQTCVNPICSREGIIKAPQFVINHFHIREKNKTHYVCEQCYDNATECYEILCGAVEDHQPLYHCNYLERADFVEILDSSDEETETDVCTPAESNGQSEFNQETLDMIKGNLNDVIAETLSRINIDQQMKWNRAILSHRIDVQHEQTLALGDELKRLQKLADQMQNRLYRSANVFIEELPSFDLTTGKELNLANDFYPPDGDLVYPEIVANGFYYSVRERVLAAWKPCRVTKLPSDAVPNQGNQMYKVAFFKPINHFLTNSVPRAHLAFARAPLTRLQVGVRVIALYKKENKTSFSYFPGIVAEPLQSDNGWRYLILFDSGHVAYVQHENVRVVCDRNWERTDAGSKVVLRKNLDVHGSVNLMVQVSKNQYILTELNGILLLAKVINVDASLVQMFFERYNRLEWIYRGSPRLHPTETQSNLTLPERENEAHNEPYNDVGDDSLILVENVTDVLPATEEIGRNVAKKSTGSQPHHAVPNIQPMNKSIIYLDDENENQKGELAYYTPTKRALRREIGLHECGTGCLYPISDDLSSYGPLCKPLLSGWERQICKIKRKNVVVYRGPCDRRLRDMTEIHQYLRMTKCTTLNVENFDFDCSTNCLSEYQIKTCIVQNSDLSGGIEVMPVPCVNYYDGTIPPSFTYSAKRIPKEGVNLNLDEDFLCGCDCEDDCSDKTKCKCHQLTMSGANAPNKPPKEVGYHFKRLSTTVTTGIYECNPRCKCSKACLNRVVQNSLQTKLQVFKTPNRGWGLRCLNDISKGTFICCYAGDLLTDKYANKAGVDDEYYADLDYIEVVERQKEGYESDAAIDDDTDEDDQSTDTNSEPLRDFDKPLNANMSSMDLSGSVVQSRYNTRNAGQKRLRKPKKGNNGKYKSVRKHFGKSEKPYIMDAKHCGNIGRYINHSCAPNLFVQNVFVDTHDIRFPWVSFFAKMNISAGTELTWEYGYVVGSVKGKELYCQCGSENCRGRLL